MKYYYKYAIILNRCIDEKKLNCVFTILEEFDLDQYEIAERKYFEYKKIYQDDVYFNKVRYLKKNTIN